MTDDELEVVATRLASLILSRISVPQPHFGRDATDTYPEKLSRTQAARFVGGKPFKLSAHASGSDHSLLRDLRVKPIFSRHHFHGRETRARDYFSKSALSAALASRRGQ